MRANFPYVASSEELCALQDARVLATMAKRVFAAGFRWRVIEAKWDGFEEAFHGFDIDWVAGIDGAGVNGLAQDTRIVRNRTKIVSTIKNALYVQAVAEEHGSFGAFLARWPRGEVVQLWEEVKKGGDRLGGDTGPWFLRSLGFDTFRFSRDVSQALVEAGVVDKAPTGKRAQRTAQEALVAWSAESGLSLGAVSVVLARSTGDVYAAGT